MYIKDNDLFYCRLYRCKSKDFKGYIKVNCDIRCRMCEYSIRKTNSDVDGNSTVNNNDKTNLQHSELE